MKQRFSVLVAAFLSAGSAIAVTTEQIKTETAAEYQKRMGGAVSQPISKAAADAAASKWEYEEKKDEMTSKLHRSAVVRSDNTISLDFPYKGSNYGQLTVRQHPQYGLDVIFAVDKGQFSCSIYNCKAVVKFDEGAPVTYSASEPADHSSNVMFIQNKQDFIRRAKSAKTIRVQTTYYQNGDQVLTFSSGPLVWK